MARSGRDVAEHPRPVKKKEESPGKGNRIGRHSDFPSGLPRQYYLSPKELDFSVRDGKRYSLLGMNVRESFHEKEGGKNPLE